MVSDALNSSDAAELAGRLEGRIALVTGAGGALGCGIARRLSNEGAKVLLVDDNWQLATATAHLIERDGGRGVVIGGAITERMQADRIVREALESGGAIDILVAAAEYKTDWVPLANKTEAMVRQSMRAFYHTLWIMQASFSAMRDGGGGSIIALGSTHGHFTQRFIADYKATKEAIRGLVLSAAQEWGAYGIRVNLLECAADTPEFHLYRSDHEVEVDEAISLLPLRRMGDPFRDIGGAALFLASDDSQYLTGEIIHADGGEHLSAPVFDPVLVGGYVA